MGRRSPVEGVILSGAGLQAKRKISGAEARSSSMCGTRDPSGG